MTLREIGSVDLLDALDYPALLAERSMLRAVLDPPQLTGVMWPNSSRPDLPLAAPSATS